MTPLQFLEIFLVAIFAGVFGAMLGLGGGIILVPALILILHVDQPTARAASLISVIATSSAATIPYLRDRYTDVRLGLLLETSTALGAVTGVLLAVFLSDRFVAGLFALLLTYSAYAILRPTNPSVPVEKTDVPNALEGSYFDRVLKRQVVYRVIRLREGLLAGFFAGNVSAILGVGGGLIQVPVMTIRMGVPIRVAAATSTFIMGVTAAATSIPYYFLEQINPYLAAPCALGVLLGARAGAKLAQRTRALYLRVVFAAVLLFTAYSMAKRAELFVLFSRFLSG